MGIGQIALVAGSFAGTGQSAPVAIHGRANVSLSGIETATVQIERSYDNAVSWKVASRDGAGAPAEYEADADVVIDEPERGILYRLNCTAHSAGTVVYRISQ
jgi:hypothetical protein